ncbi:alkaline phosphatase family protein [Capillimicrobium parvum]|uniref:Phosphatidylinositol-3-phosphatase n=1 Tax=Capillimicrobium parvum TaxID=2884022 RepID=A0A9E6XWJ3_9ACTN|nr:alkaline phosphatase family protein [Capillimicrobium parvum]UGS35393.1 Phosphatidylinositol-3-phosphatase [Capillimicrobium parvum]
MTLLRLPSLLLALLAAVLAPPVASTGPAARASAARSHVVTIVLENKEEGQVIGSRSAPYLTSLARRGGRAMRSYGVGHPSLPNYLALTSGSTHGIASDCTSCSVDAPSIADQIERAGMTWKAYLEGLPRPCFLGAGERRYAKKHNPFAYYEPVVRDRARCRRMVPLTQLDGDLRGNRLPAYSLVVPDLCHDMHDCSVATGDRFLRTLVPPILRRLGPRGFLVITFDEGASDAGCCGGSSGGRIATIVVGPGVRRGARMQRPIDQYGVLRSTQQALGLPPLAASADPRHGGLEPLFGTSPRIR